MHYSRAHARYFPVADDWCTAYICIDDNTYIVTIFGQRCRNFANVALTFGSYYLPGSWFYLNSGCWANSSPLFELQEAFLSNTANPVSMYADNWRLTLSGNQSADL